MNKGRKLTSIIAALLLIGSISAFGAVKVSESDLVVSEDFAVSYVVQPTDDVIDFLADYGIELFNTPKEITMDIDSLRSLEVDYTGDAYDFNDTWTTVKDELNYLVNAALFEARRDGYDAVYMELGNTRWIMYPHVEEE